MAVVEASVTISALQLLDGIHGIEIEADIGDRTNAEGPEDSRAEGSRVDFFSREHKHQYQMM